MTTNLLSPFAWATVPFKDPDAFTDFLHVHEQWQRVLCGITNVSFRLMDDLRTSLSPHGHFHDQVADALGLPRVGDWVSYDLTDEQSYVTFMQLCSQDMQRLRLAAGV